MGNYTYIRSRVKQWRSSQGIPVCSIPIQRYTHSTPMDNLLHEQFEAEMSQCCKCSNLLARKCVDPTKSDERVQPRPIIPPFRSNALLLVGQAPGLTEYRTGKAFQGAAGKEIRDILAEVGIPHDRFDEVVYSTAVVKCFPGSKHGKRGREDEKPSAEMVRNCLPYLQRQMESFRPQIVITLGRFPLIEYLKLRGRNPRTAALDTFVGTAEKWGSAVVVFLPHTSGSSRWLNKPENKQLLDNAKSLLRSLLLERNLAS